MIKSTPLETFMTYDPIDGVRVSGILSFSMKYVRIKEFLPIPMGQSITHDLLRGIIHNFDENSPAHNAILRMITYMEYLLIQNNKITSNFGCIIAEKAH